MALAVVLVALGAGVVALRLGEGWLARRMERSAAAGRIGDCLADAGRLEALRWLPGPQPLEEGLCRRAAARWLWSQGRREEALRQQHLLLAGSGGRAGDRHQLAVWEEERRGLALQRFRAGDLDGALAEAGSGRDGRGPALAVELRRSWDRNRLLTERAGRLVAEQRWWEALDALNRVDHPWWRRRGEPLRAQVGKALARMAGAEREHDAHGALPHTVPAAELDGLVRRRLAAGRDEWQAFQEACAELGGRIVEAGPDSACQR